MPTVLADTTMPALVVQHHDDGGTVVPSGVTYTIATGATLDIASGGTFSIAGTAVTATAAEINAIAGGGLSATELGYLDTVVAGTVTASKAVVVDANKDVASFRDTTHRNVDCGASGTAGTVDVFPSTASKGKIQIAAADSAGDTTTTITNASQAAARTYTIPDAGASASFMMTAGAQSASGNLTLASGADLIFSGTTGQSEITFTDNLADALSVKITGGADFLVFDSTDTNEKLTILSAATQKLSFFGVTPVVQGSAYTQTYSTADKTHANLTSATLTDNTAGSANTTLQALADGTTYANDVAAIRNNFADLAASNNAIIADLTDLKQLANSIIDDLQAFGLVA